MTSDLEHIAEGINMPEIRRMREEEKDVRSEEIINARVCPGLERIDLVKMLALARCLCPHAAKGVQTFHLRFFI